MRAVKRLALGWATLATAACASSQNPDVPAPETRTRMTHPTFDVEIFNQPGVDTRLVSAPMMDVWRILPTVYDTLDIPVTLSDPQGRQFGNPRFRPREIGGERLSVLIDCGRGVTATPNADRYDVILSVVTTLRQREDGSTEILTYVDGSGKPRAVSGNAVHCSSKGILESVISELVTELVGAVEP